MSDDTESGGVEHELLAALIQWSFEHPAEWDEWRLTLLVFSTLSGLSESTILQAHTEAQKRAGVTEPDEVADAFETAEALLESAEERDLDLPEISVGDGDSR